MYIHVFVLRLLTSFANNLYPALDELHKLHKYMCVVLCSTGIYLWVYNAMLLMSRSTNDIFLNWVYSTEIVVLTILCPVVLHFQYETTTMVSRIDTYR